VDENVARQKYQSSKIKINGIPPFEEALFELCDDEVE
jgi:hypothetical protein